MSKRADAIYLKEISKVLPVVKEWAKIPLLVLDKDTHIYQEATTNKKEVLSHTSDEEVIRGDIFNKLIDDAISYTPARRFVMLDKSVELNNTNDLTLKHNYYLVSISEDTPKTLDIMYPTQNEGIIWFFVVKDTHGEYQGRILQANGKPDEVWSKEKVEAGDFEYKGTADIGEVRRFMSTITIWLACILRAIGYSDLHAVETKGVQHRKVHAKKPWQRSDLATIVYLNKLPTEHREPLGGTHRTPMPHPRRGHPRRLLHERYKNHPRFGDTIWIKPIWVGPRETTVSNITYKVL